MSRLVRRPDLTRILEFCAEDPVERVFLEDVARRGLGRFSALDEGGRLVALCHVGANVVPSGRETARLGARELTALHAVVDAGALVLLALVDARRTGGNGAGHRQRQGQTEAGQEGRLLHDHLL